MPQTSDWREMLTWIAQLLQERTGENVAAWNRSIEAQGFADEGSLRDWLMVQGISGYTQNLLV